MIEVEPFVQQNSSAWQSMPSPRHQELQPEFASPMPGPAQSSAPVWAPNDITIKEAMPRKRADIDAELEALLAQQKTHIKVIGCGGAGNNTINRIAEVGVKGAETIALNTDAQDLLYTTSDKKILIGRETTRGLGAGSNPKLGEDAAREQEMEIKKSLEDAVTELKKVMNSDDMTVLKSAMEKVSSVAQRIGAAMYQQQTQNPQGEKKTEDVVEGTYEDVTKDKKS